MSHALPVESRPLLCVGDDGEEDDDHLHHHCQRELDPAVDWLAIARHTLADVSRTLPDARSSELRVKSCDVVISKIEAARDIEHGPSLRPEVFKMPQDRPSAGTEIARVRASMEIVATRIRDAVALDVRRRLLAHSMPASTTTAPESIIKKAMTSSDTQTALTSSSSIACQSDVVVPDNSSDLINSLEHSELLDRNSIERQTNEELLDVVSQLLHSDRREMQRVAEEHQQLKQQQQQQQQESTSPEPTTTIVETHEVSIETEQMDTMAAVPLDQSRDVLEELETNARGLVSGWEQDIRDKLRSALDSVFSAAAAVDRARISSSFFETWRCFALKRREENLRADRERHQRILQYTLDLQESQINGSLDSIVVDNNDRIGSFVQPAKPYQYHVHHRRGVSPGGSSGAGPLFPQQEEINSSMRYTSPGVSPVPMSAM